MGGEQYTLNNFDSDDEIPINIFQKIKNKKAKKDFTKIVAKTKMALKFQKNYQSEKKQKQKDRELLPPPKFRPRMNSLVIVSGLICSIVFF